MRSPPTGLMPQLYCWLVALADPYDGFLIDLDGVVWLGHEPIERVAKAIAALAAAGKPFVFVTNSSPGDAGRAGEDSARAGIGKPTKNGGDRGDTLLELT